MKITKEQLKKIMPKCNVDIWTDPLNEAMQKFEINTSARAAAFLAQVAHESNETNSLKENLYYSAPRMMAVWPRRFPTLESALPYAKNPEKLANLVYANRGGNGDAASGDGYRYRGRGLFQLTFKDNYRLAENSLKVDLVQNPDLVATPEIAALTAADYWNRLGLNSIADHQEGDDDEKDFEKISIKINGGRNGLAERKRYWAVAREVLC